MKIKKNILILGGSGFIGRNLVENFDQKYNIFFPSHKELDLLDESSVSKYFASHKIDIVINCAVEGGSRKEEREEDDLNHNLITFFNIVRNKDRYKKLIQLGSGAEYNKNRPLRKIKEEDFDNNIPQDNYGLFKYICSKYIEKKDNIINLRLFGLFGKYEDYRYRFISNAICRKLFNLPIILKQDVYFDYVYIDDFIRIVDYFINHENRHRFYNIGTGSRINILSIAKIINEISEDKSKIVVGKKGVNNEYTCNNQRLMTELPTGFKFMDIKDSIQNLHAWYTSNKKNINENYL